MITDIILNDIKKIDNNWEIVKYITNCYNNFLITEDIIIDHYDDSIVYFNINGADHCLELIIFLERYFIDSKVLERHRKIIFDDILN